MFCNECNEKIDKNDTICKNCGCPIEKKNICEECGNVLSKDDNVCNECGCPVKNEELSDLQKAVKDAVVKTLNQKNEDISGIEEGGAVISLSLVGAFIIFGPIALFIGIFFPPIIIIGLVALLGYAIYLIYNIYGTKEKRNIQKRVREKQKKEYHEKYYNADGKRKSRKQLANEEAIKEKKRINSLGVYPTKVIEMDYIVRPKVYIDDNNCRILIKTREEYVISYDDIIDFELLVDDVSQIKYTLGTYFTGQFKGSKKVNDICVSIYLNNINHPRIDIHTYGDYTLNTELYKGEKFANELMATLKYIKNKK